MSAPGAVRTASVLEDLFDLGGKAGIVTGASRGIGAALVHGLAGAGATVYALARSGPEVEAVCRETDGPGAAVPLVCDVTDTEQLREAIGTPERLDFLVNNAGANRPAPLAEVTLDDLDAVMALNLRAAYLACQHAAARMTGGGSIVGIASQMSVVGAANRSVYCMTKAGLVGLTRALAIELAPAGIRVNAVSPTFLHTPFTEPMFADEAFHREVLGNIPLGRIGSTTDVLGAVLYLVSGASGLVTGTNLLVDGGWTAR